MKDGTVETLGGGGDIIVGFLRVVGGTLKTGSEAMQGAIVVVRKPFEWLTPGTSRTSLNEGVDGAPKLAMATPLRLPTKPSSSTKPLAKGGGKSIKPSIVPEASIANLPRRETTEGYALADRITGREIGYLYGEGSVDPDDFAGVRASGRILNRDGVEIGIITDADFLREITDQQRAIQKPVDFDTRLCDPESTVSGRGWLIRKALESDTRLAGYTQSGQLSATQLEKIDIIRRSCAGGVFAAR